MKKAVRDHPRGRVSKGEAIRTKRKSVGYFNTRISTLEVLFLSVGSSSFCANFPIVLVYQEKKKNKDSSVSPFEDYNHLEQPSLRTDFLAFFA